MIPNRTLSDMVRTIHSFSEFNGVVIGYYGSNQCSVLHPGATPSVNFGRIAVIIEEVIVSDPGTIADTRHWIGRNGESPEGAPNPTVITNRSVWGREAVGVGLSCGFTIVSAVGVFGGAAAEVPSAGTSTILVVAAWAGMITSGIQCVNGIVRVGAIISDPDGNTLERWDQDSIYSASILIVDAVGLVAGIASLPSASRNLYAIMTRQGTLARRGLSEAALRGMNRAQRAQVIRELVEEASRTPEGRAAIMAAAREAQVAATSLARPASMSVRNATRMVGVISAETVRRLNSSLLNVISTPLQVAASATPPSLIGSASGSANWLIHLVDAAAGG